MTRRIYMDYNATTPVHPEVVEEMLPFYLEHFGNPSSLHVEGRRAKEALDGARARVAALVGCDPEEVVFTSCATEGNNWAIKGVTAALRNKGNHIITTVVEHPSVISAALYMEKFGYQVTCLNVDRQGMLDLAELEEAITDKTILITAMFANNETGTIFPVEAIGEIAARHGIIFHTDAVQAVGKVPVNFKELNAALLSLSGHKLYAPKGVGALIVKKGSRVHPFFHGGRQEKNRRAGTENVAGIVGLGKACELALHSLEEESLRLARLRDRLERSIVGAIPGVRVNGHPRSRLPHTLNMTFLEMEPGALLTLLDRRGVAASSGSACCSGALKSSSVSAVGTAGPSGAQTHLRLSLGRLTTEEEIDFILDLLPQAVAEVREAQRTAPPVAAEAGFAPDCE